MATNLIQYLRLNTTDQSSREQAAKFAKERLTNPQQKLPEGNKKDSAAAIYNEISEYTRSITTPNSVDAYQKTASAFFNG